METLSPPLLESKLSVPPTRSRLVSRPRLLQRLNDGLTRSLALVSAPAGFGKTTLLCDWVNAVSLSCAAKVAWLGLDDGDNDPARLLAYLVAALQVQPHLGEGALGMPRASSFETALAVLHNDLAHLPFTQALVLDDYHVITSPAAHHIVEFLLERLPPQMHLVIATRADPALPLARLRARDQLVELRQADLRFSPDEASQFLHQAMGLDLTSAAVATLETRTEGWAAGLQLAALSLQSASAADTEDRIASFAGDHRYIFDYLVDQVLRHQSTATQTFLLNTAVLNRLTASLCDAVLSDATLPAASQTILEQLDAANLFLVPLDTRRLWYRYHHLFAEVLRYRLQREQPGRAALLHRRASEWYAHAGDADEAIYHALAVPDVSLAAQWIEHFGMRIIGSSRLATFLGWVQRLPQETVFGHAYLCAGCAWAHVLTQNLEQAGRYVQAGEEALARFEPIQLSAENRTVTEQEVRGHLTAVRAYRARLNGDSAAAVEYSREALRQLPAAALGVRCAVALNLGLLHLDGGDIEAARGDFAAAFEMAMQSEENIYVALSALQMQGSILIYQGQLRAASDLYRRLLELGKPVGGAPSVPAVAMGHAGLAQVHYQRYDLKSAAAELEKAHALLQRAGNLEGTSELDAWQARLEIAVGNLAQAQAIHDRIKRRPNFQVHLHETTWWAIRAELALARGDARSAGESLTTGGFKPADLAVAHLSTQGFVQRLPEYVLWLRVLMMQGQLDPALEMSTRLIALAEEGHEGAVVVQASVLQAVAWHLKRDDARALACLGRALMLAAPEEYNRPFVQAGEPMVKLLQSAVAANVQSDYARNLLTLCQAGLPRGETAPLGLTDRETQILRLLAAGLSSNEIAGELVLAVSTVRSYIKTLYGKLDVHNRVQAVDKARELGLL